MAGLHVPYYKENSPRIHFTKLNPWELFVKNYIT